MYNVIINKDKLLAEVRKNQTKHIEEYKSAQEAYKRTLTEELQEKIKDIHDKIIDLDDGKELDITGLNNDLMIRLPKPKSYEKSYTTVIKMLEFHTEENVELSQSEFRQYVQDEWDWTSEFKMSNSVYTSCKSS